MTKLYYTDPLAAAITSSNGTACVIDANDFDWLNGHIRHKTKSAQKTYFHT